MSNNVPQNIEAEESVLGAMLLSERAVEDASSILQPEAFYRERHQIIYRTMLDLFGRGIPPDTVTIGNALQEAGKLEAIGGKPKLAELAASISAAANVRHHVNIVRDTSIARALVLAGQRITHLGSERPGPIEELIDQAEQALMSVTSASGVAQASSLTDGLEELRLDIRESFRSKEAKTGLQTGYAPLDNMLLGFWPGQLIIQAARPGQGKSAFALNIAENVVDAGGAVLFVSLEMSKYELQIRSLARAADVDGRMLMTGQLSADQAARLAGGFDTVNTRKNLHINDHGGVTLAQLNAEATRLKRTHAINLIVIDYIQLMTPPKAETRNIEVSVISRGLKLLARRLNVPILALSQLNRESANEKRRPRLSDLRDSGSLEQDADVVILLYNPTDDDPDKQPTGDVEVIVAKNRRGPTDTAKLAFNRSRSRFMVIPSGPVKPEDR